MKKIVIAPDSYKDCASALEICNYIENGFKQVFADSEYVKYIMADGGEGTVDSLILATDGVKRELKCLDPLFREVDCYYGISQDKQTAFIEMAQASGLERLSIDERNPLKTTTFGTGQMIKDALEQGVKHIIIGIGGSATCDAGIGMARALGIKFYNNEGEELNGVGGDLVSVKEINFDDMIELPNDLKIDIACDVDNPLYGMNGSSYIYNKQKGADEATIKLMDEYLEQFATKFDEDNIALKAGAGAAGGLGFGLEFFLNGSLRPGSDIIIDYLQIEKDIVDADLVITGEGMTDHQSTMGKAPIGISKLAKKHGVNTIMLSAAYGKDYQKIYEEGITASFSPIKSIVSLEKSIKTIEENLTMEALNVARTIKIGLDLKK